MPSNRPSKRRKISKPRQNGSGSASASGELFSGGGATAKSNSKWDEEQDYEQLPRKMKDDKRNRLPIKTSEGWVDPEHSAEEDDNDSFLASDDEDQDPHTNDDATNGANTEPAIPFRQQVVQAKEDLARLAALVNEDPEENMASLRALGEIAQSDNPIVKQLAIATQCTVYKDIIPGYRIRSLSAEDMTEKVSKEVKKLRSYEQSLISGYQAYVKELTRLAKHRSTSDWDTELPSTAISCASTLLLSVTHFNFRGELLKIIIGPLSRKTTNKDYEKSIKTLEKLFKEDDDGRPSLEAVAMLTKMIKARDYQIHESLLNVFLSLRLLSDFALKGSYDRVDKAEKDVPRQVKRLQEKRVHRSKRDRKMIKEQKILEKEMKEADAVVSHEDRDKMQSEMLKLVFATYFRILKAKTQPLMGAVLEGLAKYAHLINQDFFGDILEALKELIRVSESPDADDDEDDEESEDKSEHEVLRDATRESLLCIVTAFALLQGQDGKDGMANLHLDLSSFITHLYRSLIPTTVDADVELSSSSLHLPDPLSTARPRRTTVNVKTKTDLLIRCLSSVLLPRLGLRSVPPLRLAAFTKQLMTASLQLPEKSCQAMLGLIAQTTNVHGKKIAGLWNTEERRGDGVFDALRGDVEGSNPFSSTVWEGELLRLHFSPKIKEALKIVEANIRTAQAG
jgi:nucleolar complex protein 3